MTGGTRRRVAHALALAFLAGEWRGAAMVYRGADALGAGGLWLRQLVADVRAAFPDPPLDAIGVLTAFVDDHEAFREVWHKRWLEPVVRRFYVPRIAMGQSPWSPPALPTVGDLQEWLGVSEGELAWLADRKGLERHARDERLRRYRYRWVAKRSGGARLLEAPKGRLRAIQRRILHEILGHLPAHDAAHGFCAGRSPRTHAELHAGKGVVVRADLRAFFADVPLGRMYGIYRTLGYPEEVALTLVALSTNRVPHAVVAAAPRPRSALEVDALSQLRRRLSAPHLPQGAPTSPALANLCSFGLDVRLAALARSIDATYSRYADDLTFSAASLPVPRLVALVKLIVAEEGFALNARKTRVMPARSRQTVTGVVVNQRPNLARPDFDRLKATLTNCLRHGPSTQERDAPHLRETLRGRIAWVASLNPGRGKKLLAIYRRIEWDEG